MDSDEADKEGRNRWEVW